MKTYAPIGTVSESTTNHEDLIPEFAKELQTAMKRYLWQGMTDEESAFAEYRELIAAAKACDMESDEACDILESLSQALNDFAPPFAYFGAHEGDGADFGFWPICDAETLQDARDSGYRVEISDHGNVAIYDSEDVEVWSVV